MAVLTLGTGARRYARNFNWPLAVAGVAVTAIGIVCISSAGLHNPAFAGEARRQLLYVLLGIPVMIVVSFIDYRNWQRWAPGLYIVNLLLLLFILRGGHSALGAQRWISLGPFGTTFIFETTSLVAFGVAWLIKGETFLRMR